MTPERELAEVVVAAVKAATAPLIARVAALEAREDLAPADVAATLTDLFRKELAIEPVRMQRRILRVDGSELGRVVDEPVE